jgi:hypothetical protein
LPIEVKETRLSEEIPKNSTGERHWLCKWEDRFGTWVPRPKKSIYTEDIPTPDVSAFENRLVAQRIKRKGVGVGKTVGGVKVPFDCCVVSVYYAERQAFGGTPEEDWTGSVKFEEISDGRFWEDGTPCDVPINIPIPQAVWRVKRYFVHHPTRRVAILSKMGQVNRYAFMGFRAESLRFDYPQIRTYPDDERGCLLDEVVFTFTFAPMTHQVSWRRGRWMRTNIPFYASNDFNSMLGGSW